MEKKNGFFGKSVLLAIVVIAMILGSCDEPNNNNNNNNGNGTGSGDIDSSLYGTWRNDNGTLIITFASDGITWGGTVGSTFSYLPSGTKWTAKNGAISHTYSGTTTKAYNYSIDYSGKLILTSISGANYTLTKDGGSSGGGTENDDIDSSLYGTWRNANNSLIITFSSDGITWGGTVGNTFSYLPSGTKWTAKNGAISSIYSGTTTKAYDYSIDYSGKLILTSISGANYTLTKDGGIGGGNWTPDGYSPIQLTENQWTDGNISMSGGQQWFTFTATTSMQYIHVAFGTLTDLYVQIYDSNGNTVGSNTNMYSSTSYTSRSLTSGQKYYIKVWSYSGNGTYQIAFNTSYTPPVAGGGGTSRDDAIQLIENQWSDGNISTSGGEQWFTFTATASTQYIHVTFDTLTNLYVQIYDSSGSTVGDYANLYSYTSYTSQSLTWGQAYYINVWPYSSNSGSYQIAFNTSSTPPVADGGTWTPPGYSSIQLTENQWSDGNIFTSGGQQWFTFNATASTQCIHVSFGTLNDLYVQVYDSNGSTIGSSSNLYSSYRYTSHSLTSGQRYYIKVWPYNNNGSGSYQIAFNTSSTAPTGGGSWTPGYNTIQLTENQWANGNIPTSSGQQWFTFTATASTQYIHVNFGTLSDLYVQVYDSNGSAVGSNSNLYSSTRYASRSLISDQTYYIKVWPYSGSGTYQIAFNTSSTPPISNSTVSSVTVSPSSISIDKGGTRQFSATVYGTNSPPQSVTWAVTGNAKSATFISGGFLSIAADETAATLTVTATSTFDPLKSGMATVTVTVPDSEIYIGNSTMPVDVSSYTGNNTFAKAMDYIKYNATNNTTYTIMVNRDITTTTIYLDAAGVNNRTGVTLILKGRDLERTINLVRVVLYTGVELILEENITLKARDTPNNGELVVVQGGNSTSAIFRMKDGSKITGNHIVGSSSPSTFGTIHIYPGNTFYMEGGEISGNVITHNNAGSILMAAGAVYVSGSFYMSGGVIKDNLAQATGISAGGVLISTEGRFEKTGGVIYGGSAGNGLANIGEQYSNSSFYAHAVCWQRNSGASRQIVNRTLFESDNLSTSTPNTGWTD